MDTTRNRAAILAQFLRASTADLRRTGRRVDADAAQLRANALESIDAVAGELEDQAANEPAANDRLDAARWRYVRDFLAVDAWPLGGYSGITALTYKIPHLNRHPATVEEIVDAACTACPDPAGASR